MAYKKRVYVKVKNILQERKQAAEKRQEIRHAEVIMKHPKIMEIEQEMASYGAKAIQAVGMGGDAAEFVRELGRKSIFAQEKRALELEKAGYPASYLDAKYNCEICKDTGMHDSRYCTCYTKLATEVAKNELEQKAPLKKSTFDKFSLKFYENIIDKDLGINQKVHMSEIFDYCQAYAEDFSLKSKGIIMIGQTGLGKTHLSLAIANRVIEKGFDVYYDSTQSIMDKLEKIRFKKQDYNLNDKDEILNCHLLILDDLGVEFNTQFTIAELNNVINTRILKGYPTIISTNMNLKEMEDMYSPRLASRIMGESIPMYFCGKVIRQMK